MYPGSSGSVYNVNKNSPGNGNGKWQGLWPSVGHARNARHINIEAGGNNRNVVFCMNQLGGVGRISNMFATTADGVQDCKDGQVVLHGGNITTTRGRTLGADKKQELRINWTGGSKDQSILASAQAGTITFSLLDTNGQPLPLSEQPQIQMGIEVGSNNRYYIQMRCLNEMPSLLHLQVVESVSSSTSKYNIKLYDNNRAWAVLAPAQNPQVNPDILDWNNRILGGSADVQNC